MWHDDYCWACNTCEGANPENDFALEHHIADAIHLYDLDSPGY